MFNKYAQAPAKIDTLNAQQGAQFEGMTLGGIEGSDFSGLGSVNNSGNTASTTFNMGAMPGSGEDQSGLGAPPVDTQAPQQPVNLVIPPMAQAPTQLPASGLGGTPIRGAASTRGWAF